MFLSQFLQSMCLGRGFIARMLTYFLTALTVKELSDVVFSTTDSLK